MMTRQPRHKREDREEEPVFQPPEKAFSEEIPSPEKLQSDVLMKAIGHPLTSIPLIFGSLLVAYAITFSLIFGGFVEAFFSGLALGIVGLVNGAWRFLKGRSQCEERLAEIIEQNLQRQREADRVKTERTIASLKTGFAGISRAQGFFFGIAERGLKEVSDLKRAQNIVGQEIARSKEGNFSFDITARVEPLIEKTFNEGLLLLVSVLDLIKAAISENESRLCEEIAEIEKDIAALEKKGDESSQRILGIKRKSLSSKKARINQIAENKKAMELLLSRADECENTLLATCDDLNKMRLENSEDALDETLQRLQDCLKVAVEVRKQLKAEGISF
mgnify:CR=1 FL=1